MSASHINVVVHLVWATWDRAPCIKPEWEERLYAAIAAKAIALGCPVHAVNGVADHVHVLLQFSATLTLAQLAQHLKGATSRLVNADFAPETAFRWQGTYGAFAVETESIPRVRDYIRNQKTHHAANTEREEWEQTLVMPGTPRPGR